MRYVEGTETPAAEVSPPMVVGTAVYALLLGIGLVVVGLKVRQRWVAFWGGGLTLASTGYLGALLMGYG